MGTWGPGNFEEDTALDHIAEFTAGMMKELEAAIQNPAELEPDQYWGVAVPCHIEILLLLARRFGGSLPDPDTANRWRDVYMEVWETHIDNLSPRADYKTNRRKVLKRTFSRLVSASRKHHER